MRDRRAGKFTYTSINQIKVGKDQDRSRHLRQLRDLIEEHDLDPSKVVRYVSEHLDDFREEGPNDEGQEDTKDLSPH